MFTFVRKEGRDEGVFDKERAPPLPQIQNLTAPSSSPGGSIESSVFSASNQAEEIVLVRNQGL